MRARQGRGRREAQPPGTNAPANVNRRKMQASVPYNCRVAEPAATRLQPAGNGVLHPTRGGEASDCIGIAPKNADRLFKIILINHNLARASYSASPPLRRLARVARARKRNAEMLVATVATAAALVLPSAPHARSVGLPRSLRAGRLLQQLPTESAAAAEAPRLPDDFLAPEEYARRSTAHRNIAQLRVDAPRALSAPPDGSIFSEDICLKGDLGQTLAQGRQAWHAGLRTPG